MSVIENKGDPTQIDQLHRARNDPSTAPLAPPSTPELPDYTRKQRRAVTPAEAREAAARRARSQARRMRESRDSDTEWRTNRRQQLGDMRKRFAERSNLRRTPDILSRYRVGQSLVDLSVIIDIGTRFTKAGFAVDPVPRHYLETDLRTIFPRKSNPAPYHSFHHLEQIRPEETYITRCPLSKETWQISLTQFLSHLFLMHLQIKNDRQVYVIENPFWPNFIRDGIQNSLFEIGIPRICFLNSLVCPVFCTGNDTALVVDIGYATTKIQGLVGGHICIQSRRCEPLGMFSIIEGLKEHLKTVTRGKFDCDKYEIKNRDLESCIIRMCFVQGRSSTNEPKEVEYEFPIKTGKIMVSVPGSARHKPCESLFGENSFDLNVAKMICETLISCPIDVRCRFARNILLTGGVCHLPGIEKRIGEEILFLVENEAKFRSLNHVVSNLAFIQCDIFANCRTWTGAGIGVSLKAPLSGLKFVERPSETKQAENK